MSAASAGRGSALLPKDGHEVVALHGQGIGLSAPMIIQLTTAELRQNITLVRQEKKARRMYRTVIGKIEANMRKADVHELYLAGGKQWMDLRDDLILYHVTREVFVGITIPWMTKQGHDQFIGGNGGLVDEPVPGGVTIYNPAPTHFAPPEGAASAQQCAVELTNLSI